MHSTEKIEKGLYYVRDRLTQNIAIAEKVHDELDMWKRYGFDRDIKPLDEFATEVITGPIELEEMF